MATKKAFTPARGQAKEDPYETAQQQRGPQINTRPTAMQSTTANSPRGGRGRARTRIAVHYDVGFNNTLYLRGQGANLSWDRGVALKNMGADLWVWETDVPFSHCEFKVLINDTQYENGDNHHLNFGGNADFTPSF